MTQNQQNTITVTLLDRRFDIVCPPNEVNDLHESARYLDEIMRRTRDNSNIVGIDRIAIISALNIAHEVLALKRANEKTVQQMTQRINDLQKRIEQTLTNEL
jgi:cell division protein ZapA